MAKAFVKYNFSAVPEEVIAVWYENSAPNAEVGRLVIDGTTVLKEGGFTADNLNPVMYQFKFYQSSNSTTLETLLLKLDIDATSSDEHLIEQISFVVDDGVAVGDGDSTHLSPVDGSYVYRNNKLADPKIVFYHVQKAGYGFLSSVNDIQLLTLGGFQYINGGVFAHDEEYLILVYRTVAASPTSVTATQFAGVIDLTGNITFGATHYNKLLAANLSVPVGVITIPLLSSIPSGKFLHLATHDGSQNNVQVKFTSPNTARFLGRTVSTINIGKGEEIRIYFDGGKAYVVQYDGDYRNLGKVSYGYASSPNDILLDGAEYTFADHPRAKEYIDLLPSSSVTTYSAQTQTQSVTVAGNVLTKKPNTGLFARSADGLKFRVPDYRNQFIRTLKYFDGTADSERLNTTAWGGAQAEDIRGHKHKVTAKASGTSGNGQLADGRDDGQGTQVDSDATGGNETRVDNIGLPAFITL